MSTSGQKQTPTTAVSLMAMHAERFMLLGDVKIDLSTAGVDIVAGANGNGKTAVSWAISCLIDPSLAPDEPIKHGEKTSTVRGDFGAAGAVEFTVITKWWRNKNTGTLETKQQIEWPGGAVTESRVAEWVRARLGLAKGDGRFDPFELARMGRDKPGRRAQLDIVRRCVPGLDVSDLDTAIATAEAERTPLGSAADKLEAQLAGIVIPEGPGEVGAEIDTAAIAGRKGEAAQVKAANDRQRDAARAKRKAAGDAMEALEDGRRQLAELQRRVAAAEERARLAEIEAAGAERAAAQLVDPDTSAIDREVAEAQQHNAGVRKRQELAAEVLRKTKERDDKAAEAQAARRAHADKVGQITGLRRQRAERIAACRLPVEGLVIGEHELLFDDGRNGAVPLAQASAAQQVRLWLALRLALHPRLRFIAVDSWSLLDDTMAEAARAWAIEHGVTILAEYVPHSVVAPDGEVIMERPPGIILEAGAITADLRPRTLPAAVAEPASAAAGPAGTPPVVVAASSRARTTRRGAQVIAEQTGLPVEEARALGDKLLNSPAPAADTVDADKPPEF